MAVPIELQPKTIARTMEQFTKVEAPLSRFFPFVPNTGPGNHVTYDVLAYSRVRGEVNTRGGEAKFVEPPVLMQVDYVAETWREGIHISAQTLKDLREPGSSTQSRGQRELARAERELRLRLESFWEWLRAEALMGIKTYKPKGSDTEVKELLLCTDDCLQAYNTAGAWNYGFDDGPTQAEAQANLANIMADLDAAKAAIARAGCVADTLLLDSVTRRYISTNVMISGNMPGIETVVLLEGGVTRIDELDVVVDDGAYVHPLTGVETNYIPDNVAIVLDSDNTRSGRVMRECEAVHVEAPPGHFGAFYTSDTVKDAPGRVDVTGEWTGGPEVAVACSQYVYQDVTAGAES